MAIGVEKVHPESPEMAKGSSGNLMETWRLTGDGSATQATITSHSIRNIRSAVGSGNWSHDLSSSSGKSVTITFPAAPANGLKFDVTIEGSA